MKFKLEQDKQIEAVPGAAAEGYFVLQGDGLTPVPGGQIIEERETCLYVNGQELVTMAATPVQLEQLAVGFLANEGLVASIDEFVEITIKGDTCVDIWLDHPINQPVRKVLTSGCTGGVTFGELAARLNPLDTNTSVKADELRSAARALYDSAQLYPLTRGVHTSILWRDGQVLAAAEDVGRHNTLDKLRGFCMQQRIATRESILVSTGRISSDMLTKAVRMECAIVVSRTSATSLSVRLAREWNVTLIGYLRGNATGSRAWQMIVYSHPERLDAGR